MLSIKKIQIIDVKQANDVNLLITEGDLSKLDECIICFYLIINGDKISIKAITKRGNKIKNIRGNKNLYHKIKNNTYIYFFTERNIDINTEKVYLCIEKT